MVSSPKQAECVTCANQHRGNRVHSDPREGYVLSSELSSKRILATPLTRTTSAKTINLLRPFATTRPRVMDGLQSKDRDNRRACNATSPYYVKIRIYQCEYVFRIPRSDHH